MGVDFNRIGVGRLPALVGIEMLDVAPGLVAARLAVRPDLLAPNGYLHAATVVALADTACGYGTVASLPPGGEGFTTIELKTNFVGTAREGVLRCEATLAHGGRTTQVWDARVSTEGTGRLVALFRCTQLVLYPRIDGGPSAAP
jgi:1,4-dihydroxy-2-naphthoyl-CoA hydrolase